MPMPFRRRKSKEHVAVDAEAEAEAAAEREAELAAAARKEEARLINEAVTRRLSEMKQVDDEVSLPSPSEPGKQPTRTRRRSHDGTYGRTLGGDAMAWLEFRESSLGMSKKDIEKAKEGMKQKQEQLTQRELKSSESAAPAVASASSAVASAPSAVALAPSTVPLSPPADRPAAYPVCKTPKDAAKAKVSSRDRLAAMQKEADEKKAALGIVPVDSSTDEEKSASAKVAVGAAKAAAKYAGGVFLTFSENALLREKLRELERKVDELKLDKATLSEKLREHTQEKLTVDGGSTGDATDDATGDATGDATFDAAADTASDERKPIRPPASAPGSAPEVAAAQSGIFQVMGNVFGPSPFGRGTSRPFEGNPSPPPSNRPSINVNVDRIGSQGGVLGAVGAAISSVSPFTRRVPPAAPPAAPVGDSLW